MQLSQLPLGAGFRFADGSVVGKILDGNDCEVSVLVLRKGDKEPVNRRWSPSTVVLPADPDLVDQAKREVFKRLQEQRNHNQESEDGMSHKFVHHNTAEATTDAPPTGGPAEGKKKGKKKGTGKPRTKKPSANGEKKMSALDAAAEVLKGRTVPMSPKELIEAMESKGLWKSPGGKTPAATLSAAIGTEIAKKGKDSRFKKASPGHFEATGK